MLKLKTTLAALLLAPLFACSKTDDPSSPRSFTKAETASLARIPIQHDDRVKPLDTFFAVTLLPINGKRSVYVPDEERFGNLAGKTLKPSTWGLELLFRPERAQTIPSLLVTNSDALTDIAFVDGAKKRRDRYSYNELLPARKQLVERYDAYRQIDRKQRSLVQQQVLNLANSFFTFELLQRSLDFARARFDISKSPVLQQRFAGKKELRFSDVAGQLTTVVGALRAAQGRVDPSKADEDPELKIIRGVLHRLEDLTHSARMLLVIPDPTATAPTDTWQNLGDLIMAISSGTKPEAYASSFTFVHELEQACDSLEDAAAFASHLENAKIAAAEVAASHGAYEGIDLEIAYHKADYVYRSLMGFVFAFLLTAFSWLFPRARLLWWSALGTTGASLAYLAYGITVRCILRGRPPVLTIYDTILFITAVGIIIALFMEWINRRRIAGSLAPMLGSFGLFVANRKELSDGVDTMKPPVAVLDTNFWLAVHVTTVTIGYAAGLLAGFLASIYLIGRLFNPGNKNYGTFKSVGRMVYGVICFGVLFATFGTITGGIWANDSWGRFWGWDPKENGALLIVIYMLMILHARLGGHIRDYGICIAAVLGNCVVGFSWWGVNELDTGLHSYGRVEGVSYWLWFFYGSHWAIALLGLGASLRDRTGMTPPIPAGSPN